LRFMKVIPRNTRGTSTGGLPQGLHVTNPHHSHDPRSGFTALIVNIIYQSESTS
jgi:hypothetical protein